MSLPKPPRYLVTPMDVLEDAYSYDPPRRALYASFNRIISLSWESKYQYTPPLNEAELIEHLQLSRRQYFEQRAEMVSLGWLQFTHPSPGFVRFSFSRAVADEAAAQLESAENRTSSAENRTDLKRIEEEESIEFNKQESSSSFLKESEVRKTALTPSEAKMQQLLENLHLLFEPKVHGVLDIRPVLLAGIPDRAIAWIAKAYQERSTEAKEGLEKPIGVIVKHVLERDAPNRYYLNNYLKILPEEYLEVVQEIEYSCDYCDQVFAHRTDLDQHVRADHAICDECGKDFLTDEARRAHYAAEHDPYRARPEKLKPIEAPALDGTIETAWLNVLSDLQRDMPRASFDTWVRDTELMRYDGNAVTIGACNSYARTWLTDRLTDRVQQLLSQVLEKPVTVTFVVQSESTFVELEEKAE